MRTYLTEEQFQEQIDTIAVPYLEARKEEGFFQSYDGRPLHYCIYRADAPRGTVTVVHGFTETMPKYRELAYMLLCDGLNVCLYEQRGHGKSFRQIDNLQYIYLDDFSEYVRDLECFISQLVGGLSGPHYLYSHSMGGGISAMYLEQGSVFFKKAVLSSPMIAPQHGNVPFFAARLMCRFMVAVGRKAERVFLYPAERGLPEWDPVHDSSEARFWCNEYVTRSCPEYQTFAPTYSWLDQSLAVPKKLLAKGAPESIAVPVRVYSAGRDTYVLNDAQKRFTDRVPSCDTVHFEEATHTLFMCTDEVTHAYFDSLLAYFD